MIIQLLKRIIKLIYSLTIICYAVYLRHKIYYYLIKLTS